jgi:ABC-type protease/lipase transport system fused ATPase/permease subunit
MFVLAPVLTTIVLAGAVLYGVLRWATYTPLRQASAEAIVWSARRDSHFLETMRGIKTIKLFNAKEYRRAHWLNLLVETINAQLNAQKLQLLFKTANSLLLGVLAILVIWLGAEKVLENAFSVGLLVAFIAYKDQFLKRISELINRVVDLRMLRLHAERLADIALSEPEPRTAVWDPMPRQPGPAAIEVRNLCFRYSANDRWVIDNVSFRIDAGEAVAITGPSGCGKTTLLKLLAGLLPPNSGEILIDGEPLSQIGVDRYCAMIGVVMQDDQLFAGSVGDNICFFADDPDHERIQHCARMACVHDDIAVMPMRYGTLIGDMGTVLSGGQKQRVLIARALYRQPAILMLDEATSHLDVDRERAVNAAVSAADMTRIIIAHRPETVRAADRSIVLEDGRISRCERRPPIRANASPPRRFSRADIGKFHHEAGELVDQGWMSAREMDRGANPKAKNDPLDGDLETSAPWTHGSAGGGYPGPISSEVLATASQPTAALREASPPEPPLPDAGADRPIRRERRMAGWLLSGALLCIGIAGLATSPLDAVSSLAESLLPRIPVFHIPDLAAWIRPVQSDVSDLRSDALSKTDGESLEIGVPPPEQRASIPVSVQAPEPAAIASSDEAKEPKPPAPTAADTATLVARGDAFISARDIASARLFYERAVEMGNGHAALRMGATFDPAFLGRADIRGTKGDPEKALFWYQQARDLGDMEADGLLKALERR